MIQRIRRKFIRIALIILSATMLTLAVVINLANWINVSGEMRETLSVLMENGSARAAAGAGRQGRTRRVQNTLDESRYFLARLSQRGGVFITDSSRVSGSSAEELREVISRALESGRETGRVGNYLYLIRKSDETGAGTAVFLDVETRLDGLHRLLLLSAVTCVGGIGIAWLLVELFSGKAIQPLIRNAVQQKQFITDAGHELKTPLTVISANMDALELKTEPSEWIDSTREQISQMRSLVNDMIYLSRMDEDGAEQIRETVDLSALVREETESFQAMAEFTGKTLETEAEEGLCVRGDPGALRKLVSQLCDNAMKYAPEEDTIRIALKKAGREIRLTEENSLAAPLSDEALSHLFDRFYRPDASRSRESGGYGIGLSMVRAVAEKHGGRAWAERTSEGRIRFVCELPQSREA